MSWEEFCEEYFYTGDAEAEADDNEVCLLESLVQSPLNLNTVTREELLQLPFLNEAQADSLLSFRVRKHGFWSWGDLMMVRGMDYVTRRYLSLFAYVGDVPREKATWGEMLGRGKHELESRLDIPLYQRSGQRLPTDDEFLENPNRLYLGNGMANVVRYRYHWQQSLRYGATFQKDAGEPFGQMNNYPYDYNSAYFYYKSPGERWEVVAGDYELSQGQGLLLGNGFFSGPGLLLDAPRRNNAGFRPHTSAEENLFYRGAAARFRLAGGWSFSAFLSRRKLDALVEDDIVRSLQTSGLHRTLTELERKDALGCTLAGGRVGLEKLRWAIGAGGYYAHFDLPFSPRPRLYNRYYLRGTEAAGFSLDWSIRMRKWSLYGEGAADRALHLALTQTLRYTPFQGLDLVLQHRHFSPRFVAPFAKAFARGSRVANEHGALAGLKYAARRLSLRAYADVFYFPSPTYQSSKSSHGVEILLQGDYVPSSSVSLQVRYKLNSKQRNIVAYDGLLEYASSHRLRLSALFSRPKFRLRAAADMTLAGKQTTANSFGWMLSLRSSYEPSKRFTLGAFGGVFFTDDYLSACYAYQPQLRYGYVMPAFFDHGYSVAAVARYRVWRGCSIGVRYGLIHYFNRETIGSDTQQINSPTQQDVSLQAVLAF